VNRDWGGVGENSSWLAPHFRRERGGVVYPERGKKDRVHLDGPSYLIFKVVRDLKVEIRIGGRMTHWGNLSVKEESLPFTSEKKTGSRVK